MRNQPKRGLLVGSLFASAALILSACGNDSTTSGQSSNNGSSTNVTTAGGVTGRDVKIAFSAPGADHGWTAAITKTAREQAAKHDDVEFNILEGTNDAAAQVAQVESLIAQKPDVLVILPQDGAALTPVAIRAQQAGIKVVNVDREFTDPAAARATIVGDNYGVGFQAGQYHGRTLNCTGNIVEIQGLAGISVTTQRSQGFKDGLAKQCPQSAPRIVATQPADFDPGKGLTVMENILQGNRTINSVYTHDDDMAEGVIRAINNANRGNEMFVTGVGGSATAFNLIESGTSPLKATFMYNPTMAASAVNLARLVGQGKGMTDLTELDVPSKIILASNGVFKENVAQYKPLGYGTKGGTL